MLTLGSLAAAIVFAKLYTCHREWHCLYQERRFRFADNIEKNRSGFPNSAFCARARLHKRVVDAEIRRMCVETGTCPGSRRVLREGLLSSHRERALFRDGKAATAGIAELSINVVTFAMRIP